MNSLFLDPMLFTHCHRFWCFESPWWIASEIKMKEIRVKKIIIAENVSFNESVAEVIMDRERQKKSKIESSKQPKTERILWVNVDILLGKRERDNEWEFRVGQNRIVIECKVVNFKLHCNKFCQQTLGSPPFLLFLFAQITEDWSYTY